MIEKIFSNIRGGVERECERQEVPPSCSIESEQSVSLDNGGITEVFRRAKQHYPT